MRPVPGARPASFRVADKIMTMKHGGGRSKGSKDLLSYGEAAKLMNVCVTTVKRARKVRERATPELIEAPEKDVIPVSMAGMSDGIGLAVTQCLQKVTDRHAEDFANVPDDAGSDLG